MTFRFLCPCPVRILSLLPLYPCTVSTLTIMPSSQTVPLRYSHVLSLHHLYKEMSRQYSTEFTACSVLSICTAYVQRLCHLYSTTPDRTPFFQQIYCPCLVSTPYLVHISSQNTISHAHIQSVHYLFCTFPMRTLPLLAMLNQYTISFALVQSECQLKLSVRIPSECHLSYTCPLREGIHIQKIG